MTGPSRPDYEDRDHDLPHRPPPSPKRRMIETGRFAGDLGAIGPFILLGRFGDDLLRQPRPERAGQFTISVRGLFSSEAQSFSGLIFPLALCTNATAQREAARILSAMPAPGPNAPTEADCERIRQAFAHVDTRLRPHGTLHTPGVLELKVDTYFSNYLACGFRYIRQAYDQPGQPVSIRETWPYIWWRLEEFMLWANGDAQAWVVPRAFLVRDGVGELGRWSWFREPYTRLFRPRLRLARWLAPRADAPRSTLTVTVNSGEHGWGELHIADERQSAVVVLSNVSEPVADLLAWARLVDAGDLPLTVEVDEEGSAGVLTAQPVGTDDLVLFTVEDDSTGVVRFEALVARTHLARSVRDAFLRSLTDPAQKQGWDEWVDLYNSDPRTLVDDSWFREG